jgi:hypothetical protein
MTKKVYGKCCICGENKKLTFEHIPPRAAFNSLGIKLYDFFGYLLENNRKYSNLQNGAGKYTLCADCNNLTGTWYGAAYAEFAMQGMRYYKQKANGVIAVPYTIYPLRVFKQIISCFASINGAKWCEQNPTIRNFLLDPYERTFPMSMDIRMYMQTGKRSKISAWEAHMNVITGERFFGSEFGYTPFSFIYVDDKSSTYFPVLNELYPVKRFLNYGYDDRVTIYIKMPRKPCNPIALDFREGIPDVETIIQSK